MDWYRTLVRPLLFRLPPETAHHVALAALSLPLPWGLWAKGEPTDLAGIPLRNPLGLAAGLTKNGRALRGLAALGFGYLVVGTVTRRPRRGNPRPRIVRDPGRSALVNAMGLPNEGAAAVAHRIAGSRPRVPVFASIADESTADVAESAELLLPVADALELNVSCPNVSWGRDRDSEAHLRSMLRRIAPRGRVFVKLPPFQDRRAREAVLALAAIAAEEGASGLTCSNTLPVREARLAAGAGGLSGGPLTKLTPTIVETVHVAIPGLPINACGGILGPEDARRCLEAGATTVQVYTGLIFGGPYAIRDLVLGCRTPATAGS